MKRRDFLRYGIGISLASSSLYSLANMMNHAQHGNMAMMHSVPTGLMPTEAMPSGLSLNGMLPKLANQSTRYIISARFSPKRAFGFALRPILGGDLYINDLQDIRRTCLGELDLFGHFFTLFMKWNERILMY
ncbi:hypothetical protein MZA92_02175 [Haemophilus influenzae]